MKALPFASLRGLVVATLVAMVGAGAVALSSPWGSGPPSRSPRTDPPAIFDAALQAQQRGRYHEAREGYLRALSFDAGWADARFQLALLTHSVHADDEAQHNLEELEAIAPNDPRLPGLRALLAADASVPSILPSPND